MNQNQIKSNQFNSYTTGPNIKKERESRQKVQWVKVRPKTD